MSSPTKNTAPRDSTFVLDHLLEQVMTGTYLRGARLPSERDLASLLGAGRASVREALKRLEDWGVVRIRRGSGVVVRPRAEWTMDVLPAYIRHMPSLMGGPNWQRQLTGILQLRRHIIVDTIAFARPLTSGELDPAREMLNNAWENRGNLEVFVNTDLDMLTTVFEIADMLPAAWLLNSIRKVYVRMAVMISSVAPPMEHYVDQHQQAFAAMESGDLEKAAQLIDDYLVGHDERLTRFLAAIG